MNFPLFLQYFPANASATLLRLSKNESNPELLKIHYNSLTCVFR